MKRGKYNLKKRAERLQETRLRIARATLELHEILGPSPTTRGATAERAREGQPDEPRRPPAGDPAAHRPGDPGVARDPRAFPDDKERHSPEGGRDAADRLQPLPRRPHLRQGLLVARDEPPPAPRR